MPLREVKDMAELQTLVGQEVAVSDWIEITQPMIDAFANVTRDDQWIHTDAERCRQESPFGVPIAHGYLTLSMIPYLDRQSFRIRQPFKMLINSGLNKLRFMAPVRAGAKIRVRKKLLSVTEVRGTWRVNWHITMDIEGENKPACVAELVIRHFSDLKLFD